MIQDTVVYKCSACGSKNIVKNGRNQVGSPQYHCKDCGVYRVLNPKVRYTQQEKTIILKAYKERASMRGIQRVFGVARVTLSKWIKKNQRVARSERYP